MIILLYKLQRQLFFCVYVFLTRIEMQAACNDFRVKKKRKEIMVAKDNSTTVCLMLPLNFLVNFVR